MFKLKSKKVALSAAVLAAGLALANPLSASAESIHYFGNHYSSDSGARLDAGYSNLQPSYIRWKDRDGFYAEISLTDIKPDGRGPIIFYEAYGQNNQLVDRQGNHNTRGNGKTEIYDFATLLNQPIAYVNYFVCNGGTVASPQNCMGNIHEVNPYY